jgi:outer membrane lipoprotein-sorting protein
MLKKSVLALCATLVVAASAFGQNVDELIDKNIKAHGGVEKMKSFKSMRLTGKMNMGIEVPFTMTKARPENVRLDFTVQGMTGTQAYDGSTGWAVMPFMGKTEPEKMSDDMLKEFKDDADFDGPLVDYKAKGNKVEYIGREDVQGTQAYKLKVTLKSGNESFVYLDADSFLEIKTEAKRKVQEQEVESESTIGNYKDFEGLLIATQIEQHIKGKEGMSQTFTIDKVEMNPTITADAFHMPAAKKAEEKPAEPKKN